MRFQNGKIVDVSTPNTRRRKITESFVDQKENTQMDVLYGYDKYSKIWMPRSEMYSINLIGQSEHDEEKVPLRVHPNAYEEIMDFVDSLAMYTVTVKGFGAEKEKFTLTMTEEMYTKFMEKMKTYEWENILVKSQDLAVYIQGNQ